MSEAWQTNTAHTPQRSLKGFMKRDDFKNVDISQLYINCESQSSNFFFYAHFLDASSSLITSWEIDGETASDFIFGGSKITADGDCSHEIKRRLVLGRKVMTNLDAY